MAISDSAQSPTQFGGFPMSTSGGQTNPMSGSFSMPGMSLPPVGGQSIDPTKIKSNPQEVFSLLSHSPDSLTSILGPLLQQVYGNQSGLMQGIFQQQGAQGAATAQSDAMKRGLTGSSIESAGIGQAYNQANQGYNQWLSQALNQLVSQYSGAAQFDIGNQQGYYSNLAQAVGQDYSSKIQQQQFAQQLAAGLDAAGQQANATMTAGMFQGFGNAIGGFSDIRLKEGVKRIGEWHGLGLYRFFFKKDTNLDLPHGERVGFLAHEVALRHPSAVEVESGFLKINGHRLLRLEVA